MRSRLCDRWRSHSSVAIHMHALLANQWRSCGDVAPWTHTGSNANVYDWLTAKCLARILCNSGYRNKTWLKSYLIEHSVIRKHTLIQFARSIVFRLGLSCLQSSIRATMLLTLAKKLTYEVQGISHTIASGVIFRVLRIMVSRIHTVISGLAILRMQYSVGACAKRAYDGASIREFVFWTWILVQGFRSPLFCKFY